MKFIEKSGKSKKNLKTCFNLLDRQDKIKLSILSFMQLISNFLDLFGVLLIGLLSGLLMAKNIDSTMPDGWDTFFDVLGMDSLAKEEQILLIATLSVLCLVTRTLLSIYFTKKTLFFLSIRGASISRDLLHRLLSQSIQAINNKTSQESVFAVTRGVEIIALHIIGTMLIILADSYLLIIMSIGLIIVNPVVAGGTAVMFALVGMVLYRFMHKTSGVLGQQNSYLNIESNQRIVESINLFRETLVQNRIGHYVEIFGETRSKLANVQAGISFLPYVSKYVIESTVILGAALLGFTQVFFGGSDSSVATVAIFLAAGLRISPAVLRIQQGAIQVRTSLGMIDSTLDLIDLSCPSASSIGKLGDRDFEHIGFSQEIVVTDASVTHSGRDFPTIFDISLHIREGEFIGICGPSGSGKSTLIDAILGVIALSKGETTISGFPPLEAYNKWPGAVAYVPQEVAIVDGSILHNICLGQEFSKVNLERVKRALEIAQLSEFISELPDGILTEVGENGVLISGGQKQRLGLARALYSNPKILILDESTSALDSQTESDFTDALRALVGKITVILVTHRYSTIQTADRIYYIESGQIAKQGYAREILKLTEPNPAGD